MGTDHIHAIGLHALSSCARFVNHGCDARRDGSPLAMSTRCFHCAGRSPEEEGCQAEEGRHW
jgi:hypothetical protein